MTKKYEWIKCTPFAPGHIPGIEVTEREKQGIIAYGFNLNAPDEGAYLSIDSSLELLRRLKKDKYKYFRVETINNPNGGYTIAFIGKNDTIHDKGSNAGIIAPLLTVERDGWYWNTV